MSGEALREPWASLRRQHEAASFGMWVFLASEALLFSGLIMAFSANRWLHPAAFAAAGHETNVIYCTVNTLVLLSSSLSMAVGAEAAARCAIDTSGCQPGSQTLASLPRAK